MPQSRNSVTQSFNLQSSDFLNKSTFCGEMELGYKTSFLQSDFMSWTKLLDRRAALNWLVFLGLILGLGTVHLPEVS